MKVRNKTLYTKAQRFIAATVALLKKIAAERGLPMRQVHEYTLKEDGSFTASPTVKADFAYLVHFQADKKIDQLPEFLDCAKYILKNPVTLKRLGWVDKQGKPAKVKPDLPHFRLLSSLLLTYLRHSGLSYEKGEFDKIYEGFENHIYKPTTQYELTAPLIRLYGNIDEIDFGDNLKLRRISNSERAEYLRMGEAPSGFQSSFFDPFLPKREYTLEALYSHQKDTKMDVSHYVRNFEYILTVLRLFKSGTAGLRFIRQKHLEWDPIGGISYSRPSGMFFTKRIFGDPYRLSPLDKQGLLRLWRRFKYFQRNFSTHIQGKYLRLALRRFNRGIEEFDNEDKIIDFLIALEALYLPRIKEELTYRLSNRVAVLLGKDDEDSEKIRKLMKAAYGIRSKIVHGEEIGSVAINKRIITTKELVTQIEGCLRKSLRSFIVLSRKYPRHERIMEMIDRSILDMKCRKSLRKSLRNLDIQ